MSNVLIEMLAQRFEQKYINKLLTKNIRLMDVPGWLLRSPNRGPVIYLTAFRVSRAVSNAQFREDLLFLNREIELAKDPLLQSMLERVRVNVLEYLQ